MSSVSSVVPIAPAKLKALLDHVRANITPAHIVQLVPKLGKLLIFLVFLANIRSWPFVWHFRIFRGVIKMRLSYRLRMLSVMFKSPAQKAKAEDDWWEEHAPVGRNPFTLYTPFNTRAYIDDSDFYGHLSNSSYAKTLDAARFKAALEMFPLFFRAGGWIALGGTNFSFVREIPRLHTYEVYTGIAAWDNKWLYVVHKFVSKSSNKKRRPNEKPPPVTSSLTDSAPSPALHTASSDLVSKADTPSNNNANQNGKPSGASEDASVSTPVDAELLDQSLINSLPLNTVVVSQICFKIGRITVPPSLVLAINGFTYPPPPSSLSSSQKKYVHPEWVEAKKIMSPPYGGSRRKLKQFLVGGWKDVPLDERWWEEENVLGGKIEERRVKNFEVVDRLRTGMEAARGL